MKGESQLDDKYFEYLFRRYFEQLYVRAYGWLDDSEQSKDVVYESYEYLWENRLRLSSLDHLPGLLYRLVYSRCMDQLRRRQSQLRYSEQQARDEETEDPFDNDYNFEDYELRMEKMRSVIADFSPRMRQAFCACVLDGKTYREAAESMGIGQETVKTMIKRAYKILRGKMIFLLFLCTPTGW